MNSRMKKYAAAMMAAVMTLSAAGAAGAASVSAEEKKIVVIGDGISAGAKLADGEKSYVELVEEYTGASVQNFAVEDYHTQKVLDCLDDAQVQQALAQSDVILVTVGVHDIMDPFMDKAHEYMERWQFERFEDVFFASLDDYNLTETQLNTYFMELTMAVKTNRTAAKEKMLEIGEQLSAYSDAQVVIQNVYNPIDTIEKIDQLSAKRKMAYESVCNVVSTSLNESVNAAIAEISESYNFTMIDTFAQFQGHAYRYVNLSDLDVNPTAAGHEWMANAIAAVINSRKTGDVNGDNAIDAKDAAAVLVHASKIGSGGEGTLDAGGAAVADVNNDDEINALDAARILVYAAQEGAGNNPSWD